MCDAVSIYWSVIKQTRRASRNMSCSLLRETVEFIMNSPPGILRLSNGNYALQSVGGDTLNSVFGELSTQAETEGAMMHQILFSHSDADIMRPGDGNGRRGLEMAEIRYS